MKAIIPYLPKRISACLLWLRGVLRAVRCRYCATTYMMTRKTMIPISTFCLCVVPIWSFRRAGFEQAGQLVVLRMNEGFGPQYKRCRGFPLLDPASRRSVSVLSGYSPTLTAI